MLNTPLRRGFAWLQAQQHSDGRFSDFVRLPTAAAPILTTGYVTARLREIPLGITGDWQLQALVNRSWRFLRRARAATGGLGIAFLGPVDLESTAYGLLASPIPVDPIDDVSPETALLLQHLKRSADLPLSCVLRIILALRRHTIDIDPDLLDSLERWRAHRRDELMGISKWRLIDLIDADAETALLTDRSSISAETAIAFADALVQQLERNCGFAASSPKGSFHTALCVSVLLRVDTERYADLIDWGIKSLVRHQSDSGCWQGPHRLSFMNNSDLATVAIRDVVRTATVLSVLGRAAGARPQRRRIPLPAWPHLTSPEVDPKIKAVLEVFDREVGTLPPTLRSILTASPLFGVRGSGLSHYLPFWLDTALANGNLTAQASQIVLANRYGLVFCMLQDPVLDEEDVPVTLLLPLNALFFRFVHGFQGLFDATHELWTCFERYWFEYLEVTAREQQLFRRPLIPTGAQELLWQSRKTSPVKICAAAMTMLAGRTDLLPELEQLIEDLQAGHQIIDDLEDLESDLAHDNWSRPIAEGTRQMLAAGLEGKPTLEQLERWMMRSGWLVKALDRAAGCYLEAEQRAASLNLEELFGWIGLFRKNIERAADAARQPSQSTELHVFSVKNNAFVFNEQSLSLYEVDENAARIISRFKNSIEPMRGADRDLLAELVELESSQRTVDKAISPTPRIVYLGAFGGPTHTNAFINAAHKAIDLLLNETTGAAGSRYLVLLDVGGELPWEVVPSILDATQKYALCCVLECYPSRIHLPSLLALSARGARLLLNHCLGRAVDSPAALLETISVLRQSDLPGFGVNVHLLSDREDAVSLFERLGKSGVQALGFHSAIIPSSPDAVALRMHEFDRLTCAFEASLDTGRPIPWVDLLRTVARIFNRQRVHTHCGAGKTRAAIDTRGAAWPCPGYASAFSPMATTSSDEVTTWQAAALKQIGRRMPGLSESCHSCWARHLCGGGCSYSNLFNEGQITQPQESECQLILYQNESIAAVAYRFRDQLIEMLYEFELDWFTLFPPSLTAPCHYSASPEYHLLRTSTPSSTKRSR